MPGRRELRRLRDDLAAFARAVGVELADWQLADLSLRAAFTVLLWSRQSGKSLCLALVALWTAFRRPGALVLIVSGGGELGARRLLALVLRIALGSELLRGSVSDEQASRLTLTNGSEVRCVAASEASVRGWTAHLLLLDEGPLIADGVFTAVLPVVAATGGPVVAAGTASDDQSAFYGVARRGETGLDPAVAFCRRVTALWPSGSDAMPWQDARAVAAMVAAMGELRAAAEFGCEWQSGASALFPRSLLEAATLDYPTTPLSGLRGAARYLGGVDWSMGARDLNALVGVGRFRGERVFGLPLVESWPLGVEGYDVAAEIAASPARFHVLAAEATGLGGPLCTRLFRLHAERPAESGGGRPPGLAVVHERPRGGGLLTPARREARDERERAERRRRALSPRRVGFSTRLARVDTSAALKAEGFGALRLLLGRRALLLPASALELRRQLAAVSVELSAGVERVSSESGHVGDLAMALMIASLPYRVPGERRWRHLLTELVERDFRPEPAPPALAGTVGWQSVAGPELSLPGVDAESERPEMVAAGSGLS